MSAVEQEQNKEEDPKTQRAWSAVLRWTGIYLLRLLIGMVAGAVVAGIFLSSRLSYASENFQAWSAFVGLLLLALLIASVTFLPLWRGLENVNIRGRAGAVEATRNLLVPAIVFQLFATLYGGFGLGAVNFVLVTGVCFLVTLAQDANRSSQFGMLLIGGSQAIAMCLVGLLLDPLTPIDAWQIKSAPWLGAIPPIVLMVVLWKKSRDFIDGSSPDLLVAGKERGSQ